MNREKNPSKIILSSALAGCLFFVTLSSQVSAQNKSDVIVSENAKTGTTDWIITKVIRHPDEPYDKGWHRRKEIEGYGSHTSIRAGETLKVFVSTEPADKFTLDIFRMGYYGGKGGRLMKSFRSLKGVTQPTPADGKKNLIECKWTESVSFEIPKDWVSGVYLGKLSTMSTEAQAYIVFIVRDNRKADLLFQCSDMTWLAYNRWPQWRSFYDSPTSQWAARAPDNFDVGYDRPYGLFWNLYPAGFEPLTNGSGEFLMTEFPLAFWLEKEGYDVTYISNVDTHADGPGLLRGKAWLSVGHDEYWTQEMYDNVVKARDEGVSLAFFSGNSVSGRVKLLPNSNGVPDRVMTMVDRGFDEENLMGAKSYGVGLADWICAAPDHWAFEGTNMKKGDLVRQLVGWEYHGPPLPENARNLVVLAEGFVTKYDGTSTNRKYASTIYTAAKGNFVFNAATCWWNKVLSAPPAYMNPPYMFFAEGDERIRKITKNILNRMIAAKEVEQGEAEH
jgi:hypothetical protein